ncbi:MAG: hypothetical protein KME17_15545 [Cyanosarcina radialis HA8281-LM2]|jgi:hypothetical protein|nr:hypothetical protein [Cyanosarcina radialis HA8281-LM2]
MQYLHGGSGALRGANIPCSIDTAKMRYYDRVRWVSLRSTQPTIIALVTRYSLLITRCFAFII